MVDIRVSPDEKSVAIRTIFPEDAFNAYGAMTADNGGHFATKDEVADWTPLKPESE